mmetsp:Transcript_7311/g.11420  ORF Transcript_7311/g.11420 Transcript_7311/m.11420 type:complete len:400 (-) Transcript_7311:21-1220(-)
MLQLQEHRQNRGSHHYKAQNQQNRLVLLRTIQEGHAPAHCAHIPTSTHNARNGTSHRGIHIRHNGKRGALGHLHTQREKKKNKNGSAKVGALRESNQHQALVEQNDGVRHHTRPQGVVLVQTRHVLVHKVRHNAAKRPSKQVHETKQRTNGARCLQAQAKLVVEVAHHHVVDGQLNAEAASVLYMQKPGISRLAGLLEGTARVGLLHLAGGLQGLVLTLGAVLGKQGHADTYKENDQCRNHKGRAPSHLPFSGGLHHVVDTHHEDLRHATAEVAPATSQGLGTAHHVSSEHLCGPELAGHKHAANHTLEETDDGEVSAIVNDKTTHGHRDAERAKNESHAKSAAKTIAEGANGKTEHDSAGHRADVSHPDLIGGQTNVLFDLGHQRGEREPSQESHEEA